MSMLAIVGLSVCPPSKQKTVNFMVRSLKQQGELVHRVTVLVPKKSWELIKHIPNLVREFECKINLIKGKTLKTKVRSPPFFLNKGAH